MSEPNSQTQINPSIIVIIIILTIIFFLSACLHLLIRCIARNPRRDQSGIVTLTALQGQLQQLFHLHDSGVEQSFIDTLPVFLFKAITGLKDGADCAVCLCEFQSEDRLRLLPKCSHAFHLDCIDTWLLSHSTCPLCRRSLLSDGLNLPPAGEGLLVESGRTDGFESYEIGTRAAGSIDSQLVTGEPSDPFLDIQRDSSTSAWISSEEQNSSTIVKNEDNDGSVKDRSRRVISVQLGRLKIVDGNGCEMNRIISRKSYSVGSFEYVLDPSNLQVVIAPTPSRPRTSTPRPPVPGHKATFSDSTPERAWCQREVIPNGDNSFDSPVTDIAIPFSLSGNKPFAMPIKQANRSCMAVDLDSAAVADEDAHQSGQKQKNGVNDFTLKAKQKADKKPLCWQDYISGQRVIPLDSCRRASSFRLPVPDVRMKVSTSRRSLSETEVAAGWNEDHSFADMRLMTRPWDQSNNCLDDNMSVPSIAKRTINWLVGRQKRMTHVSNASSEAS
eukprot:c25082_g1_i1 orf=529-2031(+)